MLFDDWYGYSEGYLINDVNSKVIKSLDILNILARFYDLITNEKLRCKLSENAFNCLPLFYCKNVMLRWVDLYNSLFEIIIYIMCHENFHYWIHFWSV